MPKKKTTGDLFAEYWVSVYRPKRDRHYRFQWRDPRTGLRRYRRTQCDRKRDAEQEAADLVRAIDEGEYSDAFDWDEFCRTYEVEKIAHKSDKNAETWHTTKKWILEYFRPKPSILQDLVNAKRILRWQNRLRDERGVSESTIACYTARLKAALNWAVEMDLIPKLPKIHIPTIRSRGGYVSPDDLELMIKAAREVRKRDYACIQRFMRALYWSGFRLDELRTLSWDRGTNRWLDAAGIDGMPVVRVSVSGQKARRDDVRGILPEFWELCCDAPVRAGCVFPLPNGKGGQMADKTIGRIISDIGEKANLITDPETGKFASAHDLRKSFAITLHRKGMATADAQKALGHKDIRTTVHHYHPVSAVQLMAKFWEGAKR